MKNLMKLFINIHIRLGIFCFLALIKLYFICGEDNTGCLEINNQLHK